MSEAVCPRRGKWLGGCRFEPRFDEDAPDIRGLSYEGGQLSEVLPQLRSKAYVRDVCRTCGRTVERQVFIEQETAA